MVRSLQDKRMLSAMTFLQEKYDFKFDIDSCATLYKAKSAAENEFTFVNPYDINTFWVDLVLEFNHTVTRRKLNHIIDLLTVVPPLWPRNE